MAFWIYPTNEDRIGELIKLIISIVGGILVIIGLKAALIRAKASQEAIMVQSKSIVNQTHQIELSKNNQLNEQFKNAIEHLGSKEEPIVLGGISELFFLANESQKFQAVVFNILCSKLRSEASTTKHAENINSTIVRTISDYVLDDIFKGLTGDLSYSNLHSVSFDDKNLVGWDFSYSYMPMFIDKATFENCSFTVADFGSTRASEVVFKSCILHKTQIRNAKFSKVQILGNSTNMLSTTMIDSEFDELILSGNFYKAKFLSCQFSDSNFMNSDFIDVKFIASSFKSSIFEKCKLYKINFSACGFVDTVISSDVQNCKLRA
ncbi:hypothetical protein BST97_11430 [Nonlabens spongiae]|uniref:Pentapeptide repeat-containing protein n=2 Tax=Nonlabens spongiae TaxID=331648 RepID=A0A1W6MLS3_9FLAO|nr:hypothetical protein BST97_11430 [Nonlabens spongiae]